MVDLRPDQLATVNAILLAEVPDYEIWAFGSRAQWTAKDTSDLDLAIVSERPLPYSRVSHLRQAFEQSYLPFTVDVVDLSKVSPDFRKVIEKQRVVFRKPDDNGTGQHPFSERRSLLLEDAIETIIDYRGKTPKKVDFGIPLITAKIIKNGKIETPTEFISPDDYDEWMRRGLPQAGDVLLTMEAPLGEVAQLDSGKVALAQRVVALRGKKNLLDNDFLKCLLQSREVQDQLKARASGTTVQGIKQSELRKINLTLPALDEQRAIAHVLSTLDYKIELNRRINETLKEIAQALFEKLKNESADSKQLDDLVEVNAQTLGRQDALDSIEYIEISEASRGNIGNVQLFQRGKEPSRARRRVRHGDTVISTVRPDRRSYFLSLNPSPNLVASTGFAVISPIKAPWSFIHAALTQDEVFDYLGQQADGGAYPAVRPEIIGQLEVPWPRESSHVDEFHRACAPLYERAENNRRESRTLAALRDALLPKLLSGELRVGEVQSA